MTTTDLFITDNFFCYLTLAFKRGPPFPQLDFFSDFLICESLLNAYQYISGQIWFDIIYSWKIIEYCVTSLVYNMIIAPLTPFRVLVSWQPQLLTWPLLWAVLEAGTCQKRYVCWVEKYHKKSFQNLKTFFFPTLRGFRQRCTRNQNTMIVFWATCKKEQSIQPIRQFAIPLIK